MARIIKVQIERGEVDIIEASKREFIAILDAFVPCNLCGIEESPFTKMYYIPVIDVIYCERCMELWKKSAVWYKVDKKMCDSRIEEYKRKFKDLGVWEIGV